MKSKISTLKDRALVLIKDERMNDVSVLARLGPIPAKLQQLEMQVGEIEAELGRIEKVIDGAAKATNSGLPAQYYESEASRGARGERMKMRIEINWQVLNENRPKEILCEHMASDTLVGFLARLYQVKGIGVLEKLSHFKINRGMVVSRDPAHDYRNESDPTGRPYQSKPVSNSGFSALTHSSTKEKLSDLNRICHFLNFPPNAVKIDEVSKSWNPY